MTAKRTSKTRRGAPAGSVAEKFKQMAVNHNVGRHLALYLKTRDGLLIWRAYQEYRKLGLPIPENLLQKFDQFAEKLALAGSAGEVAAAIEMKSEKGGPAGATRTQGREHQRDIVEYVRNVLAVDRARAKRTRTNDSVYDEAARRFGTTKGYVAKTYREWMSED